MKLPRIFAAVIFALALATNARASISVVGETITILNEPGPIAITTDLDKHLFAINSGIDLADGGEITSSTLFDSQLDMFGGEIEWGIAAWRTSEVHLSGGTVSRIALIGPATLDVYGIGLGLQPEWYGYFLSGSLADGTVLSTEVYGAFDQINLHESSVTVLPNPEPGTLAIWGSLIGIGVVVARRRRKRA